MEKIDFYSQACFEDAVRVSDKGFPLPEQVDDLDRLIDTGRPTVIIAAGVYDDSMSIARELDRFGDVNVVILPRVPPSDQAGMYMNTQGVIYKDGKVFAGTVACIQPDYVAQDATGSDYCSDLPRSGGKMLNFLVKHKEIANAAMMNNGVTIPPSMAWRGNMVLDESALKNIGVRYEESGDVDLIEARVIEFCSSNACDEIVVKPGDGQRGRGVKFFMFSELREAAQYILDMMRSSPSVVLQKRIKPLTKMGKDWNLRVFVSRDDADNPVVSDVLVRLDDDRRGPVNISVSAVPMTICGLFELLELDFGRIDELMGKIRNTSVLAFNAIREAVNLLFGSYCDQDWIGVDIIVAEENGEFVPYVLEVNSDYTGGIYDLDTVLSDVEKGSACKDLVRLMRRRAFDRKNSLGRSNYF